MSSSHSNNEGLVASCVPELPSTCQNDAKVASKSPAVAKLKGKNCHKDRKLTGCKSQIIHQTVNSVTSQPMKKKKKGEPLNWLQMVHVVPETTGCVDSRVLDFALN